MTSMSRTAVLAAAFATSGMLADASIVEAAEIRGRVQAPTMTLPTKTLGYTKTRITAPSSLARNRRDELAIYLKVKKSLPLSPPTQKRPVEIRGLVFRPSVITCVFDESITFINNERKTVTVNVGDTKLGQIEPGQQANYKCEVSGNHEARIKEWSHVRGAVFVGEVGVAALPDEQGSFQLSAPEGEYELQVIASSGVIEKAAVNVTNRDVELGLIGAEQPLVPAIAPTTADVPPPPPPKRPEIARPPVAASPKPKPKPRIAPPPKPKAQPKPAVTRAPPPPPPKPKAKPEPKPKPKEAVDDFFQMDE